MYFNSIYKLMIFVKFHFIIFFLKFQLFRFLFSYLILIFLIVFLFSFNKTPLSLAVEKENEQIVSLLLSLPTIDVNAKIVFIIFK